MTDASNQRPYKPASASRAEQVQIVMPQHVNAAYCLFGGQLMQWADIVAGIAARRHCGCETRTVAIDHMEFLAPAHINDTVDLVGRVTWVGNTSMEVRVETYVEKMEDPQNRILINRAYFIMVAVDQEGVSTQVPGLICETEAERAYQKAGEKRARLRKNSFPIE